jgi:C4-dicarboxylate-specific signal transduction histidine kinase
MGEMASAIAHEINQPLTAIANYAAASLRLMAAGKMSQAEAADTMKRLATEAGRAGEVVRKMRGFVRGEEGHLAPVAVDQLLTDVARLSSPEARQFDVPIDIAVAPNLPPLRADAIQVQQVLLNLVRNSMEAMADAGSPTRRITMTAAQDAHGAIEIRVADTGPGVPVDRLDRVFEPFYTTKRDGMGIGLALSRSIVDAHGGRLWASTGDRGACFHLTLPSIEDASHVEP